MPVVTKIEPSRFFKTRLVVELDGEKWKTVSSRAVREVGLAEGRAISPADVWRELAPLEEAAAKERAYAMLAMRDRAREEIARDLARRGFDESVISRALDAVKRMGYIDDDALAKRVLELSQTKKSRSAIKLGLLRRGVESETVEDALEGLTDEDEDAAALREAKKRVSGREPTPEAQAKAIAALARKGFSWDTAKRAVRAAFEGEA